MDIENFIFKIKKMGINMEIRKNVFFSLIIAGKPFDEEDVKHLAEVNDVPPCCGRNWWYWKPNFRKTSIGWEVTWLCAMISYDNHNIYMKGHREQNMAQEQTKDI